MSDSTPDDSIVVYADYVCPFCYIGKASLEEYLEVEPDPPGVDWRPFDLRSSQRRPDGSLDPDAEADKTDEYYERAASNVRKLAREHGVEMSRVLARDVDSLPAHQVALGIRREFGADAFERFHDAVYDAMWVESEDVGDRAVLREVAVRADVPPDHVDAALDNDDLRGEVRKQFSQPRRSGVSGVPTFEYGDYAARGAVPASHLRQLVAEGDR